MRDASLFSKRFVDLANQTMELASTKTSFRGEYTSGTNVNAEFFLTWKVNSRHLISTVCGRDSEHYKQFVDCEKPKAYRDSYSEFKELRAVFMAAKDDFEGGYLEKFRSLIQAEVFGSELEQASELLTSGYKSAAAVVAGVVLETALRDLCTKAGVGHGKLDRMNAELTKAGVYNNLTQKRITAIAGVRNSAAHGKPQEFTDDDVKEMIEYTERFLEERL